MRGLTICLVLFAIMTLTLPACAGEDVTGIVNKFLIAVKNGQFDKAWGFTGIQPGFMNEGREKFLSCLKKDRSLLATASIMSVSVKEGSYWLCSQGGFIPRGSEQCIYSGHPKSKCIRYVETTVSLKFVGKPAYITASKDRRMQKVSLFEIIVSNYGDGNKIVNCINYSNQRVVYYLNSEPQSCE